MESTLVCGAGSGGGGNHAVLSVDDEKLTCFGGCGILSKTGGGSSVPLRGGGGAVELV